MRFLLILCVACASAVARGQSIIEGPHPAAISYLINQNFEGTGYDNSETWTKSAGTPNEDYTTTVLSGSQSLALDATGGVNQRLDSPTHTAQSDEWLYFQFQISSLPASGNNSIAVIRNGSTALLTIALNSSGQLRTQHGTATATYTSSGISGATKVHVWVHYVVGSGANGVASVAWSTDGTKPTSGNQFTSQSNGTATSNANNVRLNIDSTLPRIGICDRVLVAATSIGSNP